jgi:hypothetical protein
LYDNVLSGLVRKIKKHKRRRSPKDFNVNNPVQAAGAARGNTGLSSELSYVTDRIMLIYNR